MIEIEQLRQVAYEAGAYVAGSTERDSQDKTNAKDFVTVADIKSQDLIRSRLHEQYPDEVVLSEEDDPERQRLMYDPNFTGFILDPIDGTYNFKRDMKESAISIGYVQKGSPAMGVVYDPFKDEMYEAKRGEGAYRNGESIHVSDQVTLKGASVVTSNSYDDAAMVRNLRRHVGIHDTTGIMPWTGCPGSGVLIMTNVACGRFDAYHHNGLKPWDNAAAFLIVQEAGGVVQSLAGEKAATFTDSAVLLGNMAVVNELRDAFKQLPPELLS